MDTSTARGLAIKLMGDHGLLAKGWAFQFDAARSRFGLCSFNRKVISLSQELVELNTEEEVRKTVLHEIAHALAGHEAGHGEAWRRVAISIGDDGERCYDRASVVTPPKKFKGVCPTCNRTIYRNLRMAGLMCSPCFRSNRSAELARFGWERNESQGD